MDFDGVSIHNHGGILKENPFLHVQGIRERIHSFSCRDSELEYILAHVSCSLGDFEGKSNRILFVLGFRRRSDIMFTRILKENLFCGSRIKYVCTELKHIISHASA